MYGLLLGFWLVLVEQWMTETAVFWQVAEIRNGKTTMEQRQDGYKMQTCLMI